MEGSCGKVFCGKAYMKTVNMRGPHADARGEFWSWCTCGERGGGELWNGRLWNGKL